MWLCGYVAMLGCFIMAYCDHAFAPQGCKPRNIRKAHIPQQGGSGANESATRIKEQPMLLLGFLWVLGGIRVELLWDPCGSLVGSLRDVVNTIFLLTSRLTIVCTRVFMKYVKCGDTFVNELLQEICNKSPQGSHKDPTRSPQGSNKNPTRSPQGSHKEPTRIPQICTRTWKCLRVTLAFSLVLVFVCGNCCFLVRRLVAILVGILGSLRMGQSIPFKLCGYVANKFRGVLLEKNTAANQNKTAMDKPATKFRKP